VQNVRVLAEGSGLLLSKGSMYPLDQYRNITVPVGPPSASVARAALWAHPRQTRSDFEACLPLDATAGASGFGVERFDLSRKGNLPYW
jgi:hypothetical protein